MTYFSSRSTGQVRLAARGRLRLFDTSPYYGICICRDQMGKAETKIRDQNFEDSEKALESEFGLFPTTTNIDSYLYQWWPMATDPLKHMIPIGTNGNQATIGDQW